MQVNSDWTHHYTPEAAEAALIAFKFKGPGLYLDKEFTLLVVPNVDPKDFSWEVTSNDLTYWFYYYGVNIKDTILSNLNNSIPIRKLP